MVMDVVQFIVQRHRASEKEKEEEEEKKTGNQRVKESKKM